MSLSTAERREQRLLDAGALVLLALLAACAVAPLLWGGQAWYRVDLAKDNYPTLHWLHQCLSRGLSTGWAQDQGLGYPMADSSEGLQYYGPARWVLRFCDAFQAVPLLWAAHALWGALGAYALTRALGASAPAALAGAIATGYSGGMAVSASANALLFPQSWFPWMLLGVVLIQRSSASGLAGGAALLGLSSGAALVGGHLGHSMTQLYAAVALHLGWCLQGGFWRRLRPGLAALGAAALLAALLYGGQAFSLKRFADQSSRGRAYSAAEAGSESLSPASLPQALAPHALGRLDDNSFLGRSWRLGTFEPQGLFLYLSLAGLLLAFAGARRPEARPWLGAWALVLLYALGSWTPLFAFFQSLPILSHMHVPLRIAALSSSLLAPLVAFGVDDVRERRWRAPAAWALVLAAALLLGALALRLAGPWLELKGKAYMAARFAGDPLHSAGADYYLAKLQRWLGTARTHLAWQGAFALGAAAALAGLAQAAPRRAAAWGLLLVALITADLSVNLSGYHLRTPQSTYTRGTLTGARIQALEAGSTDPYRILSWGLAEHLRRALPAGQNLDSPAGIAAYAEMLEPQGSRWEGFHSVNQYPATQDRRLAPFLGWFLDFDINADQDAQTRQLLQRRRLYDLCGAKYIVSGRPLSAPGLELVQSEPTYLYRNRRALPLAYIAGQHSGGWDAAGAVAALSDPAKPESRWERPALVEDAGLRPGVATGRVEWVECSDHRWGLKASLDREGVLLLSRLYYPGPWAARVDGKPAPLLAANGAFCALRLGAGTHQVELGYQDPYLAWGRAGQALACLLAAALLALAWRRRSAA